MTHRFCWLNLSDEDRKKCIGQQLVLKACSRYSWDVAGPLLKFWTDHVHPCIEKILKENYSILYKKGGVHVPIACRFLLTGQTQEANSAVPTVVFISNSRSAALRAKRLLLAHDLYLRFAVGFEVRCEKIVVRLCGTDGQPNSLEQESAASPSAAPSSHYESARSYSYSMPFEDREAITVRHFIRPSRQQFNPEMDSYDIHDATTMGHKTGYGDTFEYHSDVREMVANSEQKGRACDACLRRKIKCDRRHPKCSRCQQAGLECIYDSSPSPTRKGSKSQNSKSCLRSAQLVTPSLVDSIDEISIDPSRSFWDLSSKEEDEQLQSITDIDRSLNPVHARDTLFSHFEAQPLQHASVDAEFSFLKEERQEKYALNPGQIQEDNEQEEYATIHVDNIKTGFRSKVKEEQGLEVPFGASVRIKPRTLHPQNTDQTQSACCTCVIEIQRKLYGILPAHSLRSQPPWTYAEEPQGSSSDSEASSDCELVKSETAASYQSESSSSSSSSPLETLQFLHDTSVLDQYEVYLDETKLTPRNQAITVTKPSPSLFLGTINTSTHFEFQDKCAGLSSGLDYVLFELQPHIFHADNLLKMPDGSPIGLQLSADLRVNENQRAFITSHTGVVGPLRISKTPGMMTVPGISSPQRVYEVYHTLTPGESGSLVFDHRGFVLGMAIATSPSLGITYMISAKDIIEDILQSMKAHVRTVYQMSKRSLIPQSLDTRKLNERGRSERMVFNYPLPDSYYASQMDGHPLSYDFSHASSDRLVNPNGNKFKRVECPHEGCIDGYGKRRTFSRLADLKRHIDTVHDLPKSFNCPTPRCVRVFSRKDHLTEHLRGYHKESASRKSKAAASGISSS